MTDVWVRSRASLGQPASYFDNPDQGGARGLELRVAANGALTWYCHYSLYGRRGRVNLGGYPRLGLKAAREAAIGARNHVEAGRDPRREFAAAAAGAMTLGQLVERWLAKHVRPNLRSAVEIERRVGRNVTPVIGGVPLTDLHKRDVNRVVDPIIERGRPVEAMRAFEDLRAVLRWGVAEGYLDHSPTEGMRKPGVVAPRERVLTDDEIKTVWNGLSKALPRSTACQRIIQLCLATGQRVGEIAGMRRTELNFMTKTWTIPGNRTKNGHTHIVPLSDLVFGLVQNALADVGAGDIIFPAGDGSLGSAAVARTIGRAQELSKERPQGRFGIPHWTAHDLRRTMISGLAALGVPPIIAGHIANHRSVTKANVTLAVYTRYSYDAEKRAALDRWAERLEAIVHGNASNVVLLAGVAAR